VARSTFKLACADSKTGMHFNAAIFGMSFHIQRICAVELLQLERKRWPVIHVTTKLACGSSAPGDQYPIAAFSEPFLSVPQLAIPYSMPL
jgi:hypothetical protein